MNYRPACFVFLLLSLSGNICAATLPFCETRSAIPSVPEPILFATQFPIKADFATIGSTFANHTATLGAVGRGGDLYIRYSDGRLCNLTREGGFGVDGSQDGNGIAVRDPNVHFSGAKALFSMVVGAPTQRYQVQTYFWQIYEITGLGFGQTVTISKVIGQPADANNVMPIYASDEQIIFVSDRPRGGESHLYPQHDEYESTATNTGLWQLNRQTQQFKLMQHSPSGSFDPMLDSFGRVVFTRWDHLQRDQQHDAGNYGTFDWASEAQNAVRSTGVEVFPEPRDGIAVAPQNGLRINHFFPWMIHQDGSGEETLNHIGRHELHNYFTASFSDDANLQEFIDENSGRVNQNEIENFFQLDEHPTQAGRYIGVEAPEFGTHGAGQLITLTAAPNISADQLSIEFITHIDTRDATDTPSPNHSGLYRNPMFLSDGKILATHATQTHYASNNAAAHDFRIKVLSNSGSLQVAGASITSGISKTISYWDPDERVQYSGLMWEFNPVAVRSRSVPPIQLEPALAVPEQTVFNTLNVAVAQFKDWLKGKGLALMVVRNATSRDDADKQQPYNLRVPAGVSNTPVAGKVYDISHFQFLQGDQIRGIGGINTAQAGRRVLARFLHDSNAIAHNPPQWFSGPQGATQIFSDGSVAMIVPSQRAMAWQSVAPNGDAVVRERYWITFQPGEIRVCDGCHGVNELDQSAQAPAQNQALALQAMLQWWKNSPHADVLFESGFE